MRGQFGTKAAYCQEMGLAWKRSVLDFLELSQNGEINRLFAMTFLGEHGPFSHTLTQEFMNFGILHLLVLSGSQIQHFRKWVLLFAKLTRFPEKYLFLILSILTTQALGFQAPLVRATIEENLKSFAGKLPPASRWVLGLALHGLLFSSQIGSLSFCLSYISSAISKQRLGIVLTSVFCQALICLLKGIEAPSLHGWCVLLIANFVFIGIFERIVFPIGTLCWLLAWLGVAQAFPVNFLLGKILEANLALVLVVLQSFRYIYDL